jgi:hypothetical protein
MLLPIHTVISREKLYDYLLCPRVEDDKSAFLALGGVYRDNWQELQKALQEQILPLEAVQVEKTPFGDKYSIRGALNCPNGKRLYIVSFWIFDNAQQQYRFVTLRPDRERLQ